MNNLTYIKKNIYRPNIDKVNLVALIKDDIGLDNVDSLIKKLPKHPIVKHLLYQNIKPKNIEDIGKGRFIPYSNNLEGEIAWILYSIKKDFEVLGDFIDKKNKFEEVILHSDLDLAGKILEDVQESISYSLWGIQNYYLIKNILGGTKKVREYWSNISNKIKDPISLVILSQSSKKYDNSLSYNRFLLNNKEEIESLTDSKPIQAYLMFKIGVPVNVESSFLPYLVAAESTSSVIDRFLFIREVLSLLSINESNYELILKSIEYLNDELVEKDHLLSNLKSLVSNSLSKPIELNEVEIYSSFISGNYDKTVELIINKAKNEYLKLSLLDIYVVSLINSEYEYKELERHKEFNRIARLVHRALTITSLDESINDLQNIANEYSNTEIGKYLFLMIINKLLRINNSDELLDSNRNEALYSTDFCRKIIKYKDENLGSLQASINDEFYKNGIQTIQSVLKDEKIAELVKLEYLIEQNFINKKYSQTIEICEKLLELKLSRYSEYRINFFYFISLIKCEEIKKAIKLFVGYFLEDKDISNAFRENVFAPFLFKDGDFILQVEEIESVILLTILNYEDYFRYVALDEYLDALGVNKPSEVDTDSYFSKNELIYFFNNVCTVDVMKHSITFDNLQEVNEERSLLLSRLLQIDEENSEKYIKEITSLTQEKLIDQAIKEVNKGRIAFNKEQIKNYVLNENKELLQHYRELINSSNDYDWVDIDFNKSSLNSLLENEEKDYRVVHLSDPSYIAFKSLFIKIRDAFLFSKEYGLDGYLSTRIRHGTLQNHIRSIFENQNLVSLKDSESNYKENTYWSENFGAYYQDEISRISKELEHFSSEIDSFTEKIIKDYIQVSSEKQKKEDALFRYILTEENFATFYYTVYKDLDTDDDFIDTTLEYLKRITQSNLRVLKKKFTEDFTNTFTEIINQLDSRVSTILGSKYIPDLSASIKKSRTDITNELKNISDWFELTTPTDSVFDINTILMTGIAITNRIYPSYTINPEVVVNRKIDVIHPLSIHLVYICRIMLDNIIKHSKVHSEEQEVKIEAEILEQRYMKLTFYNKLGNDTDVNKLSAQLSQVVKDWESSSELSEKINKEGGSGFDKVSRIIAYDIESSDYSFNYEIEEQNLMISLKFHTQVYA